SVLEAKLADRGAEAGIGEGQALHRRVGKQVDLGVDDEGHLGDVDAGDLHVAARAVNGATHRARTAAQIENAARGGKRHRKGPPMSLLRLYNLGCGGKTLRAGTGLGPERGPGVARLRAVTKTP